MELNKFRYMQNKWVRINLAEKCGQESYERL